MSALRLGVLAIVVVACLLLALSAGSVALPLRDVWRGLWQGQGDGAVIIRDLRAPRVALAFLVGGSLGISGAALQAMIRNP
ncbi:MAG TPA: iron chelate uptake ABC transporter family permease subunit, partial [Gemmatimonadales bacterium]|nr:iron chelate uptake ABC transporter family permease subunit [Gemmatimonadales bacterium]